MRWVAVFALLAVLLVWTLPGNGLEGSAPSWQEGDQWAYDEEYRYTGSQFTSIHLVIDANRCSPPPCHALVLEEFSEDGKTEFKRWHFRTDDMWRALEFYGYCLWLPFPLEEGKSVQHEGSKYVVIGVESIEVKAGTFDAFRVQETPLNSQATIDIWYSPKVKNEVLFEFRPRGDEVVTRKELVQYDLA